MNACERSELNQDLFHHHSRQRYGIWHTYPLEKTYKVKIGSIRDYTEERPVIRLDVGFAGGLYKDEPFGIDDRADMGTEVLLTRRIMTQMNVMVNPARKYVVTTEYSLD